MDPAFGLLKTGIQTPGRLMSRQSPDLDKIDKGCPSTFNESSHSWPLPENPSRDLITVSHYFPFLCSSRKALEITSPHPRKKQNKYLVFLERESLSDNWKSWSLWWTTSCQVLLRQTFVSEFSISCCRDPSPTTVLVFLFTGWHDWKRTKHSLCKLTTTAFLVPSVTPI